jgi:hypothetical protein
MTTAQKASLTLGITLLALLFADVMGLHQEWMDKPKHYSSSGKDHVYYTSWFVVRTPVGILTAGLGEWEDSKDKVHRRFWWFSGITVGVTVVLLLIWRRKKSPDA